MTHFFFVTNHQANTGTMHIHTTVNAIFPLTKNRMPIDAYNINSMTAATMLPSRSSSLVSRTCFGLFIFGIKLLAK